LVTEIQTIYAQRKGRVGYRRVTLALHPRCYIVNHKTVQRMIKEKGILESMSRRGNCVDNAVMENFFGLLKSELLYLQKFDSVEHFMAELIDDLDYYNNRRIKAKRKGLPPAIHRRQALLAAS
jgi:putative transposase